MRAHIHSLAGNGGSSACGAYGLLFRQKNRAHPYLVFNHEGSGSVVKTEPPPVSASSDSLANRGPLGRRSSTHVEYSKASLPGQTHAISNSTGFRLFTV